MVRQRPAKPLPPVQVWVAPPHRNGLCSVPIFLYRKISHTRRRSSSFATGTLSSPDRLQTHSQRLTIAATFLRDTPAARISQWFGIAGKRQAQLVLVVFFTYYFFTIHSSLEFYVPIFGKANSDKPASAMNTKAKRKALLKCFPFGFRLIKQIIADRPL